MKRRKRRFPRRENTSSFLDTLLGFGPLSPDYATRGLQLRYRQSLVPVYVMILLVWGLCGLAFRLWEYFDLDLARGPLGRIFHASRATRRRLSRQRKKSTRKPPTPAALEAAWAKSRRSLEWKLRLGSMLEDLEPVVDQSYIRDDNGNIVGREPGIRGWLFDNCRVISDHYKTAMGYKALAHRFRLAIDLPEPFTLEDVLDAMSEMENIDNNTIDRSLEADIKIKNSECSVSHKWAKMEVTPDERAVEKAKREAEKILAKLGRQNGKSKRPMRRSMSALDELLHDRLRLLHTPRSA